MVRGFREIRWWASASLCWQTPALRLRAGVRCWLLISFIVGKGVAGMKVWCMNKWITMIPLLFFGALATDQYTGNLVQLSMPTFWRCMMTRWIWSKYWLYVCSLSHADIKLLTVVKLTSYWIIFSSCLVSMESPADELQQHIHCAITHPNHPTCAPGSTTELSGWLKNSG